jgi:uncharacterized protein (DUF2164 family)
MKPTRTTRLAPGYYEVTTTHGTFTVDQINGEWAVTFPNEFGPSDYHETLRDAKKAVREALETPEAFGLTATR